MSGVNHSTAVEALKTLTHDLHGKSDMLKEFDVVCPVNSTSTIVRIFGYAQPITRNDLKSIKRTLEQNEMVVLNLGIEPERIGASTIYTGVIIVEFHRRRVNNRGRRRVMADPKRQRNSSMATTARVVPLNQRKT